MPHPDDDKAFNDGARKLTEEAEPLNTPENIHGEVEFICTKTQTNTADVWTMVPRLAMLDDVNLGQAKNRLRQVDHFKKDLSWRDIELAIRAARKALRPQIILRTNADSPWSELLSRSTTNAVKRNLDNVAVALSKAPEFSEAVAFNSFANKVLAVKPLPWSIPGEKIPRQWAEYDDSKLAIWLQRAGVDVASSTAAEGAATVAKDHSFDPLQEYLEGLKWDGTPRLTHMLPRYFGTDDNDYTCAVGTKWMVSAVTRAFVPGAKVDHCLVLKGPQGCGKSTAAKILSVRDEWFTDNIADLQEKDAAQNIQGKWIIEFSDLARLPNAEQNFLKSWMTRTDDNFRPSYGRHSSDHPRHCVFIATTNKDEFLADETGGRRWWPVTVTRVDLDALAADCEQLWAEAVERFREGEKIFLDDARLIEMAEAQQRAHYEPDVWDSMIATYLAAKREEYEVQEQFDAQAQRRDPKPFEVEIVDILGICLNMKAENMNQQHRTRVVRSLRVNGFLKNLTGSSYSPVTGFGDRTV